MMRVTRHVFTLGLWILLVAPGPAGRAAGDDATSELEHPLAGSTLSLVDGPKPDNRRVVFKARFRAGAPMADPSFAGSSIRVFGTNPTDGDSGVVQLDPGKWHALGRPAGSAGYRYQDATGSAGGIRFVIVKQRRRGGVLKVAGGRSNWRYVITGPQGDVGLTFMIGKARWCAEFRGSSFVRNVARRVLARSSAAPESCPCDRFGGTFEAIQHGIFERHGCTQAACHGTAPGQGGLELRAEVAYQNLVDAPSSQVPGALRVERGLSRSSVLWRELARATLGQDDPPLRGMPSGLPAISENELEAVRLWIHSGAPETGVVIGTESLLGSCLPPPDPIKIKPPAPPAPDVGIQLHAPPWKIPPRDANVPGQDGEDEVCYATWFDFSAQIPDSAKAPCPDFFGGPTNECFYYNKTELTQDPDSHHSIIHYYKGKYDITDEVYTCVGGPNNRKPCDPAGTDCAGGTCQGKPAFGPFSCLGGAMDGQPCNPKGLGVPAPTGADCGPGGGCAGKVVSSVACIFYGPPDYGFDVTGTGSNNAPSIGGSQQPVSSNLYPPQVYSMLPVKGTIVWNSHAFNLTDQLATNEQWLNLYFAGTADRVYPVRGIFDANDIFVQDVPPLEKREYCRTYTLPQGARLFQLSSHTHKRGELFRVWGPGITDQCGSEAGRIPPASCQPEAGPPVLTTTLYSDPAVVYFDPPVALDGADTPSRTYKFCSRYDNGADVPTEVKRQSTSPKPPLVLAPGGPCPDSEAACLGGPHQGQACNGDDAVCAGGVCDACPLRGGVTTEDEMFILLGLYYRAP